MTITEQTFIEAKNRIEKRIAYIDKVMNGIIGVNHLNNVPAMFSASGYLTKHWRLDMNSVTQKKCTKCGELKDKSEFSKNKNTKDGLMRWCRVCNYAQTYAWQKNNKERYNANARRREKEVYTTEKRHAKHLKKMFGITGDEYQEKLNSQSGVCAVCGKEEVVHAKNGKDMKRLAVDHDHNTGEIRGLLCSNCNAAIGYFKDEISIIERAVMYLKSWKK